MTLLSLRSPGQNNYKGALFSSFLERMEIYNCWLKIYNLIVSWNHVAVIIVFLRCNTLWLPRRHEAKLIVFFSRLCYSFVPIRHWAVKIVFLSNTIHWFLRRHGDWSLLSQGQKRMSVGYKKTNLLLGHLAR